MHSRILILSLCFVLIVVYVAGCRRAGKWLVKNDEPVHTDAMVVLMGSFPDRILQAVDIYEQGITNKLILVEAGMGTYRKLEERGVKIISGTEQIRNAAIVLGINSDSIIILPGNAQSTQQEAMIVRDYLDDYPAIDTLVLVSSSPHMRRAYMTFKNAFNKSQQHIYIICSPSAYTEFNATKWWKSKDDIETLMLEYLKLANFLLFERLSRK
jgi:uncharacterized SAM-binding protein YcdF (DUF218 family)